MIFMNSEEDIGTDLTHYDVEWVFSRTILGVMSDRFGYLEADSTFELGAAGTNYTTPFPGSGSAAPYELRGLELDGPYDSYEVIDDTLRISMRVTEPGDWIRVVTASPAPVPEPATCLLLLFGLIGMAEVKKKFSE
jgi:hypothetical protein